MSAAPGGHATCFFSESESSLIEAVQTKIDNNKFIVIRRRSDTVP